MTLRAQGVGQRIVSGASYKLIGTLTRTVLTLGSTAILARLLLPADYGYVAMATIVTELAALFGSAGMTDTLLQRKRVTRIQLDTVFWALFGVGLALAAIVALVSLQAERLFGEPKVAPILLALGLLFPLGSLAGIPSVLLNRCMDFRTEFFITTTSLFLRSVAAALAAKAGLGVWSLVIGAFTGSLLGLMLVSIRYPFLPRLRFSTHYLRGSWRVSSKYLGGGLVYYANMNVDLILVGRYWGVTALGYYQNARALADEMRARVAAPLAQTMFPAFSAVQGDPARMADLFLRASRVLTAVLLLLGASLSALSQEVVEILYGERWLSMVPLVSLFALSAALRGSTALASPLLNASNRPGLVLQQHLIGTLLTIGSVLLMLRFGLQAIVAAVALSSAYSLVPYYLAVRVFGLRLRALLQVFRGPVLGALACLVGVALLRQAIVPLELSALARLPLLALCGVSAYALVLIVFAREHWLELLALVHRILGRK